MNKKIKIKVRMDEHVDFEKFNFQFGIIFGASKKFKDVIIRYAFTQGYDLTFSLSDKILKRLQQHAGVDVNLGCMLLVTGEEKHMWLK